MPGLIARRKRNIVHKSLAATLAITIPGTHTYRGGGRRHQHVPGTQLKHSVRCKQQSKGPCDHRTQERNQREESITKAYAINTTLPYLRNPGRIQHTNAPPPPQPPNPPFQFPIHSPGSTPPLSPPSHPPLSFPPPHSLLPPEDTSSPPLAPSAPASGRV